MANDVLNVETRELKRTSELNSARRNGKIPGIYYIAGSEPIKIEINEREMNSIIASGNVIINMKLASEDDKKVVIKDVQIHPVTDKILHVDLMGIRMDKEIEVHIPIHFEGIPEGVKMGGIQQSTLRELVIRGLPGELPDVINVDVADLEVGDSIHVKDIDVPGVTVVTDEELAVVSVVTPKIVEEVVLEEELEEGVEGEEGEEGVEGEEGEEGKAEEGEKKDGDKKSSDDSEE